MIDIPRITPPPPSVTTSELVEWFVAELPDDWFREVPKVQYDGDEIILTGDLGEAGAGLSDEQQILAYREATRDQRMEIADRAQAIYLRKVSWGARCGELEARFTHVAAPAMTRLRLEERQVLDTLIEGGVARSRSEALAWCVRLVGKHETDWIAALSDAAAGIREVREQGPQSG